MLEKVVSEGGVVVGGGERKSRVVGLQARGASRAWRKHSRLEKKNNSTRKSYEV